MPRGEELPGQREIRVTASDGVYTAYISLLVNVEIVNDNPPVLVFGGADTANFTEGVSAPVAIGKR